MKKIFRTLAVLAVLALAVSCQKESVKQEFGKKKIDMHIIANQGGTKTALISENGALVPYWTEGDRVAVLELIYSKFEKDSKDWTGPEDWPEMWYCSDPVATQSKVADFSINLEVRAKNPDEKYHYIAVYPASSFRSYEWTGNDDIFGDWCKRWSAMAPDIQGLEQIPAHPTAIVEIPIDQAPAPGYFDPNADVLVSDILDSETQPESVNMKFARVGSVLKINFTGLPEGFQPLRGELKCDESWPAAYLMEYDSYLHKIGVYSKPSNEIRFDLYQYPQCEAKAPLTVWLRTISGSIREWFTVNVYGTMGEDEVVFTKNVKLEKALNIPDGGVTEINVELFQGYNVNAYLSNESVEETSISATVHFVVEGPGYSAIEYGVLFAEGEFYEEHDPSWQKTVLTVDEFGQADVNLTGLKPETYYTIAPYVIIDGDTYWAGNSVRKTLEHYTYSQPDAVDLGLSVKWASFNLGATKPCENGYHYAWAETVPKKNAPGYDYKWQGSEKYSITSGTGTMDASDDAAAVNLGNGWRLPSTEEWLELKQNCDWDEETLEGVAGIRAKSLKNGNSIFFPYAGYAEYSYDSPRYAGSRAGLMTSGYTTGGKCWEVVLPFSSDYESQTMSNTLLSVRAVK